MHPFTKQVALPEPVADVDQLRTVGDALALARRYPDRVQVTETVGVGRHTGKRYVRFAIHAPVRKNGVLYTGAHTPPVSSSDEEACLTWKTTSRTPEQVVAELYTEHEELRARYPALAAQADELWDALSQALGSDGQVGTVPERAWLTICCALVSAETGHRFTPWLISTRVWGTAARLFGISNLTELADAPLRRPD